MAYNFSKSRRLSPDGENRIVRIRDRPNERTNQDQRIRTQMTAPTKTNLEQAIADGHAKLGGEGKTQCIHY